MISHMVAGSILTLFILMIIKASIWRVSDNRRYWKEKLDYENGRTKH